MRYLVDRTSRRARHDASRKAVWGAACDSHTAVTSLAALNPKRASDGQDEATTTLGDLRASRGIMAVKTTEGVLVSWPRPNRNSPQIAYFTVVYRSMSNPNFTKSLHTGE